MTWQQKIDIARFSEYVDFKLAEGEGFEPPDPCRSPVFKTGAIDLSANLPC